jgi:hypothetical protein
MNVKKIYCVESLKKPTARPKRAVRKFLNADAMIQLVRDDFRKIPDHRAGNAKISLDDALMSALAMFQLKDPSLLALCLSGKPVWKKKAAGPGEADDQRAATLSDQTDTNPDRRVQ